MELGLLVVKKNNLLYGIIDDTKANQLLRYAYEKGVNFFDTANIYGIAEKCLVKAFKNVRSSIFIANKVGCISLKKNKFF